jgi:hypothetical protein
MKNVVGLFRNFDASRDISISALYSELHAFRRHLPGASSRTPHPLAVPRLKLVVPRDRPRLSRTSMFGAAALSAAPKVHGLPLSKATRKSRVPAARSTGTCALSVSHARALRASRVRPHGVFQAVERPHAARARLSSVAFGRINIPRWQSPKKQHFPRSRRLTPPPPRLPTPTQASACAPWPPKRSPASGFAASP